VSSPPALGEYARDHPDTVNNLNLGPPTGTITLSCRKQPLLVRKSRRASPDTAPRSDSPGTRSTTVPRSVDTNILLYAISADPADAQKQREALTLLREPDLALSTQVLAEFYVQTTRPSRSAPLLRDDAIDFMNSLLVFPVQPVTVDVVHA